MEPEGKAAEKTLAQVRAETMEVDKDEIDTDDEEEIKAMVVEAGL